MPIGSLIVTVAGPGEIVKWFTAIAVKYDRRRGDSRALRKFFLSPLKIPEKSDAWLQVFQIKS